MGFRRSARGYDVLACITMATLALAAAASASDADFQSRLARVEKGLRENPNRVPEHALFACQDRRVYAIRLFQGGESARAVRSLRFCSKLLGLDENTPIATRKRVDPEKLAAEAAARTQAAATREVEKALPLTADIEDGLEIYRSCAACHTPEGWGLSSGVVPQLAGQHRTVIIKQLADIRAGNRDNRVMVPYSSAEAIGGAQAISNVAGYIGTLEISVENGKGPGKDLELGGRLYAQHCASCHGARGEGSDQAAIPRIQAQHFDYLVTQFEWIRDGKRRNANPEMVEQIKNFEPKEVQAILDFVSRLEPPEELQAPVGWRNPDFANTSPGG